MSPVLPTSTPSLLMPPAMPSSATPFVLAPVDGGKGPAVGPDCTMPADTSTPVAATDLIAALDLAARTAVAPTIADSVAPADGKALASKDEQSDAPKTNEDVTPQAVTPVVPTPVQNNPLAALLAVAPVMAQTTAAVDPSAADDSIKSPKLPTGKGAALATSAADAPVSKPADPAIMALFARPKDMARVAERASDTVAKVSVSLLSDTDSGTNGVPVFSLPATTSHLGSASLTQMPVVPADTMINRHLDLARGDAWLDTLAQDIAASAGTGERLRFALQPEHLGKLDVEVSRHDNGVAVHMTTRSEEARAIIAAAQPRLVDDLRANGTRVVAADVASQMNAQTNSQSGGASRSHMASFIEAAVDAQVPAATETKNATASGRYA